MGYADTLPVSLGQASQQPLSNLLQAAFLHDFLDMGINGGSLHFPQAAHKFQIVGDGHFIVKGWTLGQVADTSLAFSGLLQHVHAVHQHLAGGRGKVACQHVQGGGFAGTVLPKQPHNLPGRGTKGQILHGFVIAVTLCCLDEFNHCA